MFDHYKLELFDLVDFLMHFTHISNFFHYVKDSNLRSDYLSSFKIKGCVVSFDLNWYGNVLPIYVPTSEANICLYKYFTVTVFAEQNQNHR